MYKHIEANMYPGVPHTIIVQLTKSLAKSFSNYFLGDGNKDEQEQQQFASASMHDTDTNSECSSSVTRLRARTTSETSSSVFETASMNEANGSARSIEQSDRGSKKCAFW